jgi:methylglyoxal reductase
MIAYSLSQSDNAAVLAGFTTPQQVVENLSPPPWSLTAEDFDFIRVTAGAIQQELDAAGEVFVDEAMGSGA